MSYELWSNDIVHLVPKDDGNDKGCLDIRCERITTQLAGWKKALYWKIATLGKARAYVVYDGEKIIHTSYVVRGGVKFTFMDKGDIEIGPCWTEPDYRGKGIYPLVLTRIMKKELKNKDAVAYMIIKDSNIASQRGVTKVGFVKTGYCVEIDRLKRYHKTGQKSK